MPLSVSEIGVERYFFTQIYVEANPEHEPDGKAKTIFTFDESLLPSENPHLFRMALSVQLDRENSEKPPYFFSVSTFGSFTIPKDCEDMTKGTEVGSIVARRVLMGAAREQIATLTSRGPWDTLILKAITGLPAGTPVSNNELLNDLEDLD